MSVMRPLAFLPPAGFKASASVVLRAICTSLSVMIIGLVALIGTSASAAAQGLNLIRDTEIEKLLQSYAKPVFDFGGLAPGTVSIHIVQDDSLNAFATQGNNMFIFTGLL